MIDDETIETQTNEETVIESAETKQEETKTDGKPSRAASRIAQLVAEKKAAEAKAKELADKVAEYESKKTDEPKVDDTLLKRITALEEKEKKAEEEAIYQKQTDKFLDDHEDISDAELGLIASIVESHGLVDEKSKKVDWEKGLEIYNGILEQRSGKKRKTPSVLTTTSSNASKGLKKPPVEMTDAEVKELAAKML